MGYCPSGYRSLNRSVQMVFITPSSVPCYLYQRSGWSFDRNRQKWKGLQKVKMVAILGE